jgi:SagB-type dehydrogenase family enzyme
MVGDRTVIHSSDGRRFLEISADQVGSFAAVLAALDRWQTPAEAANAAVRVTDATAARAAATVQALIETGVLETADRDPGFVSGETWVRFGWTDAYRYHRHQRLLPMIDWSLAESPGADSALMRSYLAEGEQPNAYLTFPAIATHPATSPAADRLGPFVDTLTESAENPLGWEELSAVLAFTFGQTGTRRLPVTGLHVSKTSPSGGSRHPTEAFVLLLKEVDTLRPGRYHWNVRAGALDLIEPGCYKDAAHEHIIRLRGRPYFPPVAVIVLVSICERSMFRYRESRSYRVLLHDTGHVLQTFAYVASALGRPTYRGYTVHEQSVTDLLGLEPLAQIPLAFGVLG